MEKADAAIRVAAKTAIDARRVERQAKEASGVVTMDAGPAVRAIADVNCSSILACAGRGAVFFPAR